MSAHCAVINCSNGDYRLSRWQKELCDIHKVFHFKDACTCKPPFSLKTFPTKKKDSIRRDVWKKLVNRQDGKSTKIWSPHTKARICSKHFENERFAYPTLELGYDASRKISSLVPGKGKRKLPFSAIEFDIVDAEKKKITETNIEADSNMSSANIQSDESLHNEHINNLNKQIEELKYNNQELNEKITQNKIQISKLSEELKCSKTKNRTFKIKLKKCLFKKPMYQKLLKTDSNVLFYTGLSNIGLFESIHDLVSPTIRRKWNGLAPKSLKRSFKKFPKKLGAKPKLCSKDEMLLTLMKLRLALMEQDLAHRFEISTSLVSRIFITWMKGLSAVLKSVIFSPDKGSLNFTRPERFLAVRDVSSIIDAFEIFIETPKSLDMQKLTWSEYKHHNTLKVLVGISPNSSVTFLSNCYPGSISDKKITNDSGYFDTIETYSSVMADKGFNIRSECLERNITLTIPPGKRGTYQLLPNEIDKTKKIANLRILVEQVIRQIRCFKIIAQEVPISLLKSIDDIVIVCAAIANFLPPIFDD